MIEPTDEMVYAFAGEPEITATDAHAITVGLAAVLAIVERQWQEAYGDAFQAGWWRGQHRLCPRCGVDLAREVAAERPEGADHA